MNIQVDKENKRKNIKIDFPDQNLLLSFTSNVTWKQIEEISEKQQCENQGDEFYDYQENFTYQNFNKKNLMDV